MGKMKDENIVNRRNYRWGMEKEGKWENIKYKGKNERLDWI